MKPTLFAGMSAVALASAAFAAGGDPADAPSAPAALDQAAYDRPAREWHDLGDADPASERCNEAIRRVRAESGQPELDRRPANPEESLFIKAVDQRIDGCPALVMARDTSDIRPVPEVEQGEARLMPAQ